MPRGPGGRSPALVLHGRSPRRRALRSRLLADHQREGLDEVKVGPPQGESRVIGRTQAAERLVVAGREKGPQALAPGTLEDGLEEVRLIGMIERCRALDDERACGDVAQLRPVHPAEEISRTVEPMLAECVTVLV